MKKLICKNPFVLMIILLIISIIALELNVYYMELIGNRLWGLIPVRLIMGVIMMGILYIVAGKEIFKWKRKSGRYVFSRCICLLLYNGFLSILIVCTTIKSLNDLNENWLYLSCIYFIITLMIGFFEESLFRGIIVNGLIKVMPKTKKGLYVAIIMSGIIFGLVHIIWDLPNCLDCSIAVIMKMVFKIITIGITGILLASLYLKTKNIWACMIIHTIMDFIPLLASALVGINGVSQQVVYGNMNSIVFLVNIFLSFLYCIPNLIIALSVLKKLEPPECVIWK